MTGRYRRRHRQAGSLVMVGVAALCTAGVLGGVVAAAVAGTSSPGPPLLNASGLPAAKASALQQMAAAQSKAAEHPGKKDRSYVPPAETLPPRSSGLSPAHQSPLPPSQFSTSNSWTGPGAVAGQWLVVYAGVSYTPGQTGPAVLVFAEPSDPNAANQYFTEIGLYMDSGATGPLSVVSVSNGVIDLTATPAAGNNAAAGTNTTVTFNLSTDSFG